MKRVFEEKFVVIKTIVCSSDDIKNNGFNHLDELFVLSPFLAHLTAFLFAAVLTTGVVD